MEAQDVMLLSVYGQSKKSAVDRLSFCLKKKKKIKNHFY